MKERKNIYKIFTVLLVLLIAGLLILGWYTREPRFNWEETYQSHSMEPYGTAILKASMIKSNFNIHVSNESFTRAIKKKNFDTNSVYFFIGTKTFMQENEWEELERQVNAGAHAIIVVSENMPPEIYNHAYEIDTTGELATMLELNAITQPEICATLNTSLFNTKRKPGRGLDSMINNSYKFCYEYNVRNKPYQYGWGYFTDSLFLLNEFLPLGYIGTENKVNFFAYQYGKGQFIFHLAPLFFANYNLLKTDQKHYLRNFLSLFKSKKIFWDVYSQRSHGQKLNFSKSPLNFILGNFYLKNAWFLLLSGILLFFLFKTKRLQRPVPVLPARKNSTLEYLKLLAQLYYYENNNRIIAAHHLNSFSVFVRKRYNFITEKHDKSSLDQLHRASGIDIELINAIFSYLIFARDKKILITNEELLDLNKKLAHFYKNCL